MSNREWDSEKKGGTWKDFKVDQGNGEADKPPPARIDIRGAVRGGGPGRGRGRGRGRGGGPQSDRPSRSSEPKSPQASASTSTTPPANDTPATEPKAETVPAS